MPGDISVVPTTSKICKPFVLEVMVFSPESGFKFSVMVERSCTPDADPLWKLVFDLYQVQSDGSDTNETQIVHVSYTTSTPVEAKAVQLIAAEGIKQPQADILVGEVHPAAKAVAGVSAPTDGQKQALHDSMQKVVTVAV